MTLHLAREASWNLASGLPALADLAALLTKVEVVWVVLVGAAISAMVF